MRVRDAEWVTVVATESNLTRAASLLHVTAPALSEAVRRVEAELEVRLFDRTNRGMTLTAAGQRLLPQLRKMVNAAADIEMSAKRERGPNPPPIRVGTILNYGTARLQRLTDHPLLADFTVTIDQFDGVDLTAGLRTHRTDAAILPGPSKYDDELTSVVVGTEKIVALMSENNPLASLGEVSVADLDEQTWLSVDGDLDTEWFNFWRGDRTRGGPPPNLSRQVARTAYELLLSLRNEKGIATSLVEGAEPEMLHGIVWLVVSDLPPTEIRVACRKGSEGRHIEAIAEALREDFIVHPPPI